MDPTRNRLMSLAEYPKGAFSSIVIPRSFSSVDWVMISPPIWYLALLGGPKCTCLHLDLLKVNSYSLLYTWISKRHLTLCPTIGYLQNWRVMEYLEISLSGSKTSYRNENKKWCLMDHNWFDSIWFIRLSLTNFSIDLHIMDVKLIGR
jgi:hypothetical protein